METKQGKPCLYTFKCLNCKDNHQANSNNCPFWIHCFNKEWYAKKYQELWEIRKQSIHSTVSSVKTWLSKISSYFHTRTTLVIYSVNLSFLSKEEEGLVGVLNHSGWFTFFRQPLSNNNSPRAIYYINIQLSHFWFSL